MTAFSDGATLPSAFLRGVRAVLAALRGEGGVRGSYPGTPRAKARNGDGAATSGGGAEAAVASRITAKLAMPAILESGSDERGAICAGRGL